MKNNHSVYSRQVSSLLKITPRGTKKIPHTQQFFVHHNQINDKIKEKTVSCVYLSIHSKFWASEVLYSIDDACKFLCVRYLFSPT